MAGEAREAAGGRTIITGATGFAGRHLLARLAGRTPLIGWARPGGTPPPDVPGVEWAFVDITDRQDVERAVREAAPQRIFHLAGAPNVASSFRNAVPHLQTNALGTHYLLDAVARWARDCRVLVVTSAQVYAASDAPLSEAAALKPQSPYGFTKLAQERVALAAAAEGLDVVVARPFNHIGPGQDAGFALPSFARQIALAEAGAGPAVLRVGNLETHRDITDVRDVVDAYVALAERGRTAEIYNVCSGRARRIRDLLDALLEQSSMAITVEIDPERFRPVDVPVIEGDASKLRADLGWTPRVPIERTLADILDDWRARVRTER